MSSSVSVQKLRIEQRTSSIVVALTNRPTLHRQPNHAQATMRPTRQQNVSPNQTSKTTNAEKADESPASVPTLLSQPNAYAEQQWTRASNMLHTNPTLVTHHILCMALKHRPPLHAIRFMMRLNPKAASIPKAGPTALQIAVQNTCSFDVIKALIEACPFALVATNPGSYLDPLSYAKRFRSTERDLIGLLSLPLAHWMSSKTSTGSSASNQSKRSDQTETTSTPCSSSPARAADSATATPSGLNGNYRSTSSPARPRLSLADRQELNNVKLMCASVVKGHRRLTREMGACKEQLLSLPLVQERSYLSCGDDVTGDQGGGRTLLLKEMEQQQQKHFRVQLIALDMKERAMRAHVQRMEARIVQKVMEHGQRQLEQTSYQERYESVVQTLTVQVQTFQRRLQQVEGQLEGQSRARYQPRRLMTRVSSSKTRYLHDDAPCSSVSSTKIVMRCNGEKTNGEEGARPDLSMPFVFSTPVRAHKEDPDDDSLSLLTEDCVAKRRSPPQRWPLRVGRRCWLIVVHHH